MLILLMVGLILSGCASQVPTPTPEPTPTPTPTPTPSPEAEWTLKFNNGIHAATSVHGRTTMWFTDKVEERTNGRLKFEHIYSFALTKPGEEITAIQTGLTDFSMFPPVYYPTKLFLNSMLSRAVPFGVTDVPTGQEILNKLYYEEAPSLAEELAQEGIKFLYLEAAESHVIESTMPITKLEDLNGVKLASVGLFRPKYFEAAGATPLATTLTDRGTALQTGMLDASELPFLVSFPFGLYEFAPYQIQTRLGFDQAEIVGCNAELFNSFPQDIQNILVDTAKETTQYYVTLNAEEQEAAYDTIKDVVTVNPAFSDEDVLKWANLIGEPVADFVSRGEELGKTDAAEVAEAFIRLTLETGHEFPKEWKIR